MKYLWVDAGDGPVLIEHNDEEYERLWKGVDREAIELMKGHDEKTCGARRHGDVHDGSYPLGPCTEREPNH